MGQNAAVYKNKQSLPFDPDEIGASRDDQTGEYYFSDVEREPSFERLFPRESRIAVSKRLGNISLIRLLREQSAAVLGERSIVLSRVLYSGTHGGDAISPDCFVRLENELSSLSRHAARNGFTDLASFVSDMNELVIAARKEGNPIVFT